LFSCCSAPLHWVSGLDQATVCTPTWQSYIVSRRMLQVGASSGWRALALATYEISKLWANRPAFHPRYHQLISDAGNACHPELIRLEYLFPVDVRRTCIAHRSTGRHYQYTRSCSANIFTHDLFDIWSNLSQVSAFSHLCELGNTID
jgi:hypothetical protein